MSRTDLQPLDVAQIPRLALREPEAAQALGVSASWLRRETSKGNVPSILVAGARLYPIEALRTWLAEQTAAALAERAAA
jgi:predicted DNA-binding transcriptional regulator AlpA